jgi:hypothetical protein
MRPSALSTTAWPDPLRAATTAAIVFALGSTIWPALVSGVAALAALTAVIALGRWLDSSTPDPRSTTRWIPLTAAGTAAGWAAFFALPAPAWVRAGILAATTVALALGTPGEPRVEGP